MATSNTSPLSALSASVTQLGGVANDTAKALNTMATAAQAPLRVLEAGINAVQNSVARFVQLANPAAVQRFTVAMQDMLATIGRTLVPVLEMATKTFRAIGDAIYALTPTGAKVIQVLAGMTIGMVVFGAAALAVSAVLTGGIGPLLVGIGGALAGLAVTLAGGRLKPLLDDLSKMLNAVMETVGQAIEQFMPVVETLTATLGSVLGTLGEIFKDVVAALAPAAAIMIASLTELIEAWAPLVKELWRYVGELVKALAPIWGAISALAAVMVKLLVLDVLAAALRLVTPLIKLMADGVHLLGEAIREFLRKIGFAPADLPGGKTRDSTGAAVRGAQIGDISSYVNSAYTSALGSGGDSIPQQSLEELKGIRRAVERTSSAGRVATGAANGAANAIPGVADAIPGVGHVRYLLDLLGKNYG